MHSIKRFHRRLRVGMIVGIDFGTTDSLVDSYSEDDSRLFPNVLGGDALSRWSLQRSEWNLL
jgi:molecular chaperone DnaK (HSP70)